MITNYVLLTHTFILFFTDRLPLYTISETEFDQPVPASTNNSEKDTQVDKSKTEATEADDAANADEVD